MLYKLSVDAVGTVCMALAGSLDDVSGLGLRGLGDLGDLGV